MSNKLLWVTKNAFNSLYRQFRSRSNGESSAQSNSRRWLRSEKRRIRTRLIKSVSAESFTRNRDWYRSKGYAGVFDVFKSGEYFPFIITVCDETTAERCRIFPGLTKRRHWSFPDPSIFTGTREKMSSPDRLAKKPIYNDVYPDKKAILFILKTDVCFNWISD